MLQETRKGRHNLAPKKNHFLFRDIDHILRTRHRNELFSLLYYKQLDVLVFEIGWMVLEIWEGGNPPNLADSLGIESIAINEIGPGK